MRIVIIIVTFNACAYIRKCLESIATTGEEVDVIVVDNASTDNTLELVKEFDCELVELEENVGFGKANNIGINLGLKKFNMSHCFLLNQDAYLQPNFFRAFRELPDKVANSVVAALQLNGTGTGLDSKSENFYLGAASCPEFLGDSFFGKVKQYYLIDFMNAAAWIIPAGVLKLVGGFSPSFFHYGEDRNYIDRLRFHGEELFLAPKCVVLHDRESRAQSSYDSILFKESLRTVVHFSDPGQDDHWVKFLGKNCLRLLLSTHRDAKWKLGMLKALANFRWKELMLSREASRKRNQHVFLN